MVRLSAGWAPIELHYVDYGGSPAPQIEWRPAGGEWQPLGLALLRWDQATMMQALSPLPTLVTLGIPIYTAGDAARGVEGQRRGDLPASDVAVRDQRWPEPRRDSNYRGQLLKIGRDLFDRGIGAFGPTEITFDLGGAYTNLAGLAGIDRDTSGDGAAHLEVELDGRVIWENGRLRVGDPAVPFALDVTGGQKLVLRTDEGGPSGSSDGVDWADLRLTVP